MTRLGDQCNSAARRDACRRFGARHPASASAIRAVKARVRTDGRSLFVAGTFLDYLERFEGTDEDIAAGIAAHVLRRWNDPADRSWLLRA